MRRYAWPAMRRLWTFRTGENNSSVARSGMAVSRSPCHGSHINASGLGKCDAVERK